eukprot:EG_transcript_9948
MAAPPLWATHNGPLNGRDRPGAPLLLAGLCTAVGAAALLLLGPLTPSPAVAQQLQAAPALRPAASAPTVLPGRPARPVAPPPAAPATRRTAYDAANPSGLLRGLPSEPAGAAREALGRAAAAAVAGLAGAVLAALLWGRPARPSLEEQPLMAMAGWTSHRPTDRIGVQDKADRPTTALPATAVGVEADTDFETYVNDLQTAICAAVEALDGSGKKFCIDRWERDPTNPSAGYGITRVLEGGDLIEKGAANVSIIKGVLTPQRAQSMSSRGRDINPAGGDPYAAAAMSLVFHPRSPLVPTLRADVRVFEVAGCRWYGGGCDLTPAYLFEDDAAEFHRHWKAVCDTHHPEYYPQFKKWCDEYFHLPARKEHRGVGGIFFDDLSESPAGQPAEPFVRAVGDAIVPSWAAIVARRRHLAYTEEQRQWQLLRRGRYLEFNLLYDRGVRFGMEGGRVESIMVSAPPLIAWQYNVQPPAGSAEAALLEVLRHPREWV